MARTAAQIHRRRFQHATPAAADHNQTIRNTLNNLAASAGRVYGNPGARDRILNRDDDNQPSCDTPRSPPASLSAHPTSPVPDTPLDDTNVQSDRASSEPRDEPSLLDKLVSARDALHRSLQDALNVDRRTAAILAGEGDRPPEVPARGNELHHDRDSIDITAVLAAANATNTAAHATLAASKTARAAAKATRAAAKVIARRPTKQRSRWWNRSGWFAAAAMLLFWVLYILWCWIHSPEFAYIRKMQVEKLESDSRCY